MASKPNYANENQSILNISSNPRKNHFHHAVAKYEYLILVVMVEWMDSCCIDGQIDR